MNCASVTPTAPSSPYVGALPWARLPSTFWQRSRAWSGVSLPTLPSATRVLRPFLA